MKHIFAAVLLTLGLVQSLQAAPYLTPPIPAPLDLGFKKDAQPGEVVQCLNIVFSFSSEPREITDQIFIGSDFVAPACVLPYGLVSMASNRINGRLERDSKGASEVLSIQLENNGDSLWLSECYIPESDQVSLTAAPPLKQQFILDRAQLHQRCEGRAQVGTLNKYDFDIKVSRTIKPEENLVIARWLGMPDLFRHKINGDIFDSLWLKEGVSYEQKIIEGAEFDNATLVPLSLEIREGYLVLIARYDSKSISNSDQCDIVSINSVPVGYKQVCDSGSHAILVYKAKASQLFNDAGRWVPVSIEALWGKYTGPVTLPGKVTLSIDGDVVREWSGQFGRNDRIGPYMTIGAQLEGSDPVDVAFRDVKVTRNITTYNANLIKNPNNDGKFEDSWKVVDARNRRNNAFFHNRVRWAGWNSGHFGTPYYNVSRVQEIDLGAELAGKDDWANNPPEIFVSEQFNKTYCGNDTYFLKVEIYNAQRELIGSWDTGTKKVTGECSWSGSKWVTERQTVSYNGVPRFIRFYDGGKDSEFWAGYYGPRIREAVVVLRK